MGETVPALYDVQINDNVLKPNTLYEVIINFGDGVDGSIPYVFEFQICFDYTNIDKKRDPNVIFFGNGF